MKEEFCNRLLEEFGLPVEGSHIINGHVPVKIKGWGKAGKGRRKAFCHRRRTVKGIPEHHRYCGIYPDL
ncbi:MAG: fructose-bisphosphatase class III [Enterocloster sp.]